MLITLIRHAEVQKPYQGRYIGHTDINLSKNGLDDSDNFADYFSQNFQHADFDAIYCSDLIRCRQTLTPFLQKLNLTIAPLYTDDLREKSWGRHEGLSYEEICQQEQTSYQNFNQWINVLDGESNIDFIQRIDNFKEKLSQSKQNNALIITHAGVISTFIYLFTCLNFEQSFYIRIPYASFVILSTNPVDVI